MQVRNKKLLQPFLIASLIFSPFLSIKAEDAPDISWTELIGITDIEVYADGVAVSNDGSVYITGYTQGTLSNLDNANNAGRNDSFLSKYSSDGTRTWTKLLGSSHNELSFEATTSSDGSVYITGYTQGDLSNLDNASNAGVYDAFLTKYSSDGTTLWTKLFGGTSVEISSSVATASDGSVYITGQSFNTDFGSEQNEGRYDAFLTKYSSDGTTLWTKLLGTTANDSANSVATGSDGSVYITGETKGTLSNLEDATNAGSADVFLTKYSSDGTRVWTNLLGTSGFESGYGVTTSSDGSVYITGHSRGNLSNLDNATNAGNFDAFLTKYTSDGTRVWTNLLGSAEADYGYGVATTSDGSIIITGRTYGSIDNQTFAGGVDIFVTKYSSDGTKGWTKLIGGALDENSKNVAVASDGSIYLTGTSNSADLGGKTNINQPETECYSPRMPGEEEECFERGTNSAFLLKLAQAIAASSTSTTLHTEWVQPYAAMQNLGLASMENHRALVLEKGGECNNYGWQVGDTDYCVYTNAKNTISYVNSSSTKGGYDAAAFNTALNIEKTINDKWKAGISYGYGSANLDNFNFSDTRANFKSYNRHYYLYGVKKASDKFTLKATFGGSDFDYYGYRNYGTYSSTVAESYYDADAFSGEINGIWNYKKYLNNSTNPIRLRPTAGIAYAIHNQDELSETGIGDLISIDKNQSESLRLKTGITVDKQIPMEKGKWILIPSFGIDLAYDPAADGENTKGVKGKLTNSTTAATHVNTKNFGVVNAVAKLGADIVCTKDLMFSLNATIGVTNKGDQRSYGGGFRWHF